MVNLGGTIPGGANIAIVITAVDQFSKTFTMSQKKMAAIGAAAVAVGAIMTKAFIGTINTFVDFDSAMTKSTAIMGDLSDTMRNEMSDAAREMAKVTTFSAVEAADAYFFLASAGLDAKSSIAALPQVAAFAQAGMFNMALATDLLTDAQSALGLTIKNDSIKNMENMKKVSDVLVKANVLANASVQQFSEALTSEAGAALKTFNKDVEEGVAVLAALADQGVKGQKAGTDLSRIMRLMSKASLNNKDELNALGIEVFDSSGKMKNFADIIEDMENAFAGMSDEQRTASLDAIGFTARVQGVILPLIGTSKNIRKYEKELRKAGDTTKEVANKQLESFASQLELAKSALTDMSIEIGEILAPLIKDILIPLIKKITDWFSNLTDNQKKLIIIVSAVTTALTLLGGIITLFTILILPGLTTAFTVAGTAASILLGPFGLLIIAIGAIITGLIVFKDKNLEAAEALGILGDEAGFTKEELDKMNSAVSISIDLLNDLAIAKSNLERVGFGGGQGTVITGVGPQGRMDTFDFQKDFNQTIQSAFLTPEKFLPVTLTNPFNSTNFTSVGDAILRPDGSIVKTHPQDTLIATKTPGGMGGLTIIIQDNVIQGVDAQDIADSLQDKLNNKIST
ncbi:phage tail tape measure protein [Candidatus Pacearchaeota archaeon]|nr:phage tail tape measure protein [Candidatus Pacearchaeota archaeon]